MNYIILDLEWNQGDGGETGESKRLPFEIIEIGAIKLNSDKKMINEFSELIKPSVYKHMHFVTRKLIHLQMGELEKGKPFVDIMENFLDWCGQDYIFCTWGPSDLTELQRNMRYYNMNPLFTKPEKFLDVQKLFSLQYEDGKSRCSLENAVNFLKIEKDIPFHRAFSDAYYTAKILTTMQNEEIEEMVSFDLFTIPESKKDEIKIVFPTYTKYISRGFEDKAEAIADKEVMSTRCYLCRKNIKKKVKWFTPNGKHYYSVGVCNEHGYVKFKARIKKSEDNKVYVIKTSKLIAEDEMYRISEKYDNAVETRKMKRYNKNSGKKNF